MNLILYSFILTLLHYAPGYWKRIKSMHCLNIIFFSGIKSKQIKTYFLNKKFDYKNVLCHTCPDIECLQSERNYDVPDNITICTRWKPLSYQNIRSFWNLALGIGNLNIYDGTIDDGIMYGVWESGPWLGLKMPGNSAMGWVGGGTTLYDLMVWRHTCMSISRTSGKFVLIENGDQAVSSVNSDIVDWMKLVSKRVWGILSCVLLS